MFTGIIEETGRLKNISHESNISRLTISAEKVLDDVKLGDSIAVNGVCLTVTEYGTDYFTADVMPETLKRTGFDTYKLNVIVNLERALRVGDRLGGHLVSGHIDGEATLSSIKNLNDVHELTITLAKPHRGLIIPKGSIAIDGISLTIMEVSSSQFKVGIIPHTFKNTNLSSLNVGDRINIEFDMYGKYVQAQYHADDINLDQLQDWGY